jgi:hypothetical protein
VAWSRLYVARNASATIVARSRPWMIGGRTVHRRHYATLVERAASGPNHRWSPVEAGTVLVPPLIVFLAITALAGTVALGFAASCIAFFALAYAGPMQGQRRTRRLIGRPTPADVRTLSQSTGREVFDSALQSADRVSETWPALAELIRVADAEAMLNEALWELAGVLVKAEQVHTVLVELSRPEFAQRSRTDDTAREVEEHRRATREALVTLNEEIARRVGGIQRAEAAGWTFIREKEMRRAIRAAEESLRNVRDEDAAAATVTEVARPDAGAELAEHTQSVVEAYRELTTRFRISPPEA